jgi:predicted ATPase
MDLALADQGRVVFVIGQAGSGKTALVEAFTRHAQEEHANLIAASGKCNAYTGIGDPYLPWREILGLLTGDVQARWAAGAMTRDHARRLWDTLPLAAQALVETGPDLIGTFIPRAALLQQVAAAMQRVGRADWLARLQGLGEDQAMEPATSGLQQSDLFEQYTRVLHALARQVPLVLVVDDLQWADLGSISLLFHLGRQLAGSRILIVGTYRSEEVTVGKDGARHPLEALVHEFQRDWGDVTLNLDQAGRRGFVEALLDNEPNRLGRSFRDMLHRQTGGHALFTIELLRGLQEQGALVKDSEGRWVEGSVLNWQTLPARVEAVIAQRIGRLPEPLQAALRVASVEGEVFTTEVVARVRAADEGELVARFSRELDRRHQLVHARGFQRIDSRRLSHYRFRHILFQKYLYSNLDEVERAYLHEAVGTALEALYEAQMEETAAIAPQLARHFEEAGLPHRAIPYLCLAGKRAVQLSAYEEGIAHLTKGLALLTALPAPDSEDQRLQYARQELALQLALGMAWVGRRAYGPHGERAYNRARELSQQLGETSQLCLVLGRLAIFHYVRTEHRKALELAEEALSLAERTQDPLHVALGHRYLGSILLCLGEFTAARAHFAHMISFYEPEQHHRALVSLRGSDAGTSALAYDACCLWCLGYPEQALNRSQQALAVARALGHPFSLADVLSYAGGYLGELRRDGQALMGYAEELKSLAQETPPWSMAGTYFQGEALLLLGRAQEGLVQIREGMDMYESMGVRYFLPGRMLFLAEAQAKVGQPEQGLDTLDQALAVVEETGERYWESELHRLRAELLLIQGDEVDAEASFHKAIEVARRQSARSWELRATTSLARLWQARGKIGKAREMLAATYDWFTEGFDTPDLREAKALLEELS